MVNLRNKLIKNKDSPSIINIILNNNLLSLDQKKNPQQHSHMMHALAIHKTIKIISKKKKDYKMSETDALDGINLWRT